MKGQPFLSFNEWFNKVRDETAFQRKTLNPSLGRSAQDWSNWSGYNLFSIRETARGLNSLKHALNIVRDIQQKCDKLEQIALEKWVKDDSDISNMAERMTSLKVGDEIARAEAITEVRRLRASAQRADERLEEAIEHVSDTLNQMIRAREEFDRERFQKMEREQFGRPSAPLGSSPSDSSQRSASRGSSALRAWQSVPASRDGADTLSSLPDPLASQTRYGGPAGGRGSNSTIMPPRGHASGALSSDFFNEPSGSAAPNSGGRYSGSAPPLGRGGGWDNLYPTPPASAPAPSMPNTTTPSSPPSEDAPRHIS